MDFSKILENKPLLFGIAGGAAVIVILIVIIIVLAVGGGGNNKSSGTPVGGEPLTANVDY